MDLIVRYLMWLNILTLVCCMPIITAGAAMTALHYSALKIARNEECYITKDYFKSFKENFKQATIIWVIQVFIFLVLVGDFYIIEKAEVNLGSKMQLLLMVVAIMVLFTSMFIYPVLAKFENTILQTKVQAKEKGYALIERVAAGVELVVI